MKNIKSMYLCLSVCFSMSLLGDGMGQKASRELAEGINRALKENLPEVTAASAAVGAKFGTEALAMIGAGATKVGVAIKTGVTVVATASATPYVIAGVAVCGTGYGIYNYYNPSAEKLEANKRKEILGSEEAFKRCLRTNFKSSKNKNNIPSACEKQVLRFALAAGQQKADEIISDFNKYTE